MGLEFLFGLLALVAVLAAAGMILSKNAVHSALFLILNFGCVALLFLMLDAPFISMVQIAVYTGAIMVLFLFVIMLLGAEQTTETDTRQLKWVSYAGWVLPIIFVLALGGTVVAVLGRLDFPMPPKPAPLLRVVHAANVADPVTITIGDTVIKDVNFTDVTDFMKVTAGEQEVSITDANGASVIDDTVSLANGDVLTLVATNDGFTQIHNSFATTDNDKARIIFLNLFTQDKISLIDIGRDRVLNVDAKGNITDHVLFDDVPYGKVITPEKMFSKGSYDWGFYSQHRDGTWYQVSALAIPSQNYWEVDGNTEQTIILVPDYDSLKDPNTGYIPRVLDSAQKSLVITTNQPFGSPIDIGRILFTTYLLPVNLVGFLLLVALIGVIVLTRPEGIVTPRRSSINRRRKVSRPLTSVISQQTGRDVVEDTPRLDEPDSGD